MDTQLGGLATGVGSLPGSDIDQAWATIFDELPDLPHVPELPSRGPGADMIGRTAAELADLAVDHTPSGWRLVPHPGGDQRVARELMTGDLDAVVPVAGLGYDGALKVQLVGPWTLAAALELPRGGRALRDSGAVKDIIASLAETVAVHLADVARRVPNARLVLQLDEPGLSAVLGGRVPTESGFGRMRVPDGADVVTALKTVIDAAGVPVAVHCCANDVPLRMLRAAGAAAIGIDIMTGELDRDAIGEVVEGGGVMWLGVLPSLGPGIPPTPREVADPVRQLWHELGFAPEMLASAVAVTPTCGLAGASPGWVNTSYRLLRQVSRALVEAPEGIAG